MLHVQVNAGAFPPTAFDGVDGAGRAGQANGAGSSPGRRGLHARRVRSPRRFTRAGRNPPFRVVRVFRG